VAVKGLELLQICRMMFLIRRVKERLEELFKAGEVYGSLHLCSGQEATAKTVMPSAST
jgi:acetoin:2,6-dichlorophenolindophenol oxidoreductase subunit alpha